MTATYALTPDSYVCIGSRYCVFLDARSNKYLAVAKQTADQLAPWLSGWPIDCGPLSSDDPPTELAAVAVDLVNRGVLTTSREHAKPVRPQDIPRPSRSVVASLPQAPLGARLLLAGRILRSRIWAHNRLSHDSLISILQGVAACRPSAANCMPEMAPVIVYPLIGAFHAWRGWYSQPNACLVDSLSLLHFLARFHIFPAWVFGVIAEPFQAHCWLQWRDIVLNDSLEHVDNYVPIMLV